MAWDDTQTITDAITHTEWNNMVTWIKRTNSDHQTTATLTLDDSHSLITCDTTANVITITLPAAVSYIGKRYMVVLTTDGGNNVLINCAGADVFIGIGNPAGGQQAVLANEEDHIDFMAVSSTEWLSISIGGGVGFP